MWKRLQYPGHLGQEASRLAEVKGHGENQRHACEGGLYHGEHDS